MLSIHHSHRTAAIKGLSRASGPVSVAQSCSFIHPLLLCSQCQHSFQGFNEPQFPGCHAQSRVPAMTLLRCEIHLSVCLQFGDWCMNYGKHGCRTPDTPFSLFEGKKVLHPKISWCSGLMVKSSFWFSFAGMAGTIYFLVDLLQPVKARFPAFEV